MLKTTAMSTAKKTAGCAVTYRAGSSEKFGTCPASCELNLSGTGCGEGRSILITSRPYWTQNPGAAFRSLIRIFTRFFWSHKLSREKP